jgi:Domain of unknown function (DUF4351)
MTRMTIIANFNSHEIKGAWHIDRAEALGEALLDFTQMDDLLNWLARS